MVCNQEFESSILSISTMLGTTGAFEESEIRFLLVRESGKTEVVDAYAAAMEVLFDEHSDLIRDLKYVDKVRLESVSRAADTIGAKTEMLEKLRRDNKIYVINDKVRLVPINPEPNEQADS